MHLLWDRMAREGRSCGVNMRHLARRTELAAGQYEVVVLGYALETEYELTVELVEPTRSLRPEATLALGQVRAALRYMHLAPEPLSGGCHSCPADHVCHPIGRGASGCWSLM